jgi:outer membrane protein assembly factor BamB
MVATERRPWRQAGYWLAAGLCLGLYFFLGVLVSRRESEGGWIADPRRVQLLQQEQPARPASPVAEDWPQWRGPNRDGVAVASDLLPTWPPDLLTRRKLWEQPAGEGFSAIVVAQGRAYTLMQDGDCEAAVCWDALSGKELWRFRYPARFEDRQGGNGPRSTPAVDGDRLYAVGATGWMHCLKTHPATSQGEVVWKRNLLDDFQGENLQWGVSFSPLVDGDRVYVMPGGRAACVAALNKYTGQTLWQALSDRASYSSPVLASLAGKRQVLFLTAEGLVGLNPDTGALYWRYPWETRYDVNAATPVVFGDHVFITSGYGKGCALLRIENQDGRLTVHLVYRYRRFRCQFTSPVRWREYLFGFDESWLKCLDLRQGKECWQQQGFDKGSLLVVGDQLIILGEFGKLALAQANPAAYQELAVVPFSQQRCWTVPTLAQGRLYLRDPQRILCLDLRRHPATAPRREAEKEK